MVTLLRFLSVMGLIFIFGQSTFAGLVGCNVDPSLPWCECDKYPDQCKSPMTPEFRRQSPQISTTATGIALDSLWKTKIYEFAQKNVVHPAWGIAHSERDYQTTYRLGREQGISIDLDVLFAAAFLHDLGGIGQFQKAGEDHAVRSAELVGPLLESFDFPKDKILPVKSMILGHTYYGPAPQGKVDQLFRDADILDFLGTIGIARVLAITEEPKSPGNLTSTVVLLRSFITDMPPKLSSPAAKKLALSRIDEMKSFIESLGIYTYDGRAL